MIKILKAGKKPNPPKYRQTCRDCECEFEADVEDVQDKHKPFEWRHIECPTCSSLVPPRLVVPKSPHKIRTLEEEFDNARCR